MGHASSMWEQSFNAKKSHSVEWPFFAVDHVSRLLVVFAFAALPVDEVAEGGGAGVSA